MRYLPLVVSVINRSQAQRSLRALSSFYNLPKQLHRYTTAMAQSLTEQFDYNGEKLDVPAEVAPLFKSVKVGRFELTNRMVYPPLTRCRAFNSIPQPNAVTYYTQRATKGSLVIAEGTIVAPEGFGYPCTPGIFTAEQTEGWKPITQAVKAKGAVFFCQIWHCGRASHPDFQPNGELPLAPSPIAIASPEYKAFSPKTFSMVDYPVPREMTHEDIKRAVDYFRQGARNAIEAGFDGVEIHGANGYLIDEFIKSSTNNRTDEYGGSIENRCRFPLEVVAAVAEEIGADRVGIRISPFTTFLDALDYTPYATHVYLAEQLNKFGLAYVHMVEPRIMGNTENFDTKETLAPFRSVFRGTFIAAGGFNRDSGAKAVASGAADLVAYGRLWLANPDLPKRFILGAGLNKYDRNTFYTQGAEGYTDYPTLEEAAAKQQ